MGSGPTTSTDVEPRGSSSGGWRGPASNAEAGRQVNAGRVHPPAEIPEPPDTPNLYPDVAFRCIISSYSLKGQRSYLTLSPKSEDLENFQHIVSALIMSKGDLGTICRFYSGVDAPDAFPEDSVFWMPDREREAGVELDELKSLSYAVAKEILVKGTTQEKARIIAALTRINAQTEDPEEKKVRDQMVDLMEEIRGAEPSPAASPPS